MSGKGRNEKLEMEKGTVGKKKLEEKSRGKKDGVLLECLSWPSLHYITEMLQH